METDKQPNNSSPNNKTTDNKNSNFNTTVFAVDFTKGLKKFWYLILIFTLIAGVGSFYYRTTSYVPMYKSSVSFSVSTFSYNTGITSVMSSYYDNSSAAQMSKTFPYIMNTQMMRNALKSELGASNINGTISAEAVATDSNIFKVTVVSNSPSDAFDIVNAIITVYPGVAQFILGNISLNILIEPTMPNEPYTTNDAFSFAAKCAVVGICAGLGVIALYALFRNTLRTKEDLKNKLNQRCLVEVPYVVKYRKSKDKERTPGIVRISGKHPLFKESFRVLRKRLDKYLVNDGCHVVAVTSAAYGEGKTTVALNIANAFAMSGKKTAVVDLDLVRRNLQFFLKYDVDGISDVVSKRSEDYENIEIVGDDELSFFFGGKTPITFSEKEFMPFFDYLRANYEYVFVNTSSGKNAADAVSVCNLCDYNIFVAKQDTISLDKIRKRLELLSFSSSKLLGFVFNGVQEGFSGYGGYYYGGKYGYGKYGYGKYGYGKSYGGYGYGRYGGRYGYGSESYGYGYDNEDSSKRKKNGSEKAFHMEKDADIDYIEKYVDKISEKKNAEKRKISDLDIPDNNE